MKLISKKGIIYTILTVFILLTIYLYVYYLSVIDIKNVKLEGYVLDKNTKKPIENVLVIINNDRYESDNGYKNYDEYLGHDKIKLYTDKKGYYSTVINKSAFIWINFEKKGYKNHIEKGRYSSNNMSYETYLDINKPSSPKSSNENE